MLSGLKQIKKTFKESIKESKAKEQHILYELNNHECYYTGNIDPACEVLEDYTREEVEAVYKTYKAKKNEVYGIDNQKQKYASNI